MLNKYIYFVTIAEELSISKAAQKLFISHQGLSLYLKNLEEHYGVTLLQRQPRFVLTEAGKRLLEFYRQIEFMDKNLVAQFKDMRNEVHGVVNLGIVEGRYRILVPRLLKEYRDMYPNVKLNVYNDASWNLKKRLLENELDLFLSTGIMRTAKQDKIKREVIVEEDLHIVISDNLLQGIFGGKLADKKAEFEAKGIDLKQLGDTPFMLPAKNFTSRIMLEEYLREHELTLNIIMESMHPDIHHLLAGMDYAASTCLSMYCRGIRERNKSIPADGSRLNTFRIRGMKGKGVVKLNTLNGAIFPKYMRDLQDLIKRICLDER
mgnify:CR=1 FL=1